MFLVLLLRFFSSDKFDQRNQKTGKCNYETNFSGKTRVAKISSTNTSLSFFTITCLIGHNTTIFFLNFATATVGGSVNWKNFIAQTSANYWYQYRPCLRLIIHFLVPKKPNHSSPLHLHYPQLHYFISYAILNWVQKNSG